VCYFGVDSSHLPCVIVHVTVHFTPQALFSSYVPTPNNLRAAGGVSGVSEVISKQYSADLRRLASAIYSHRYLDTSDCWERLLTSLLRECASKWLNQNVNVILMVRIIQRWSYTVYPLLYAHQWLTVLHIQCVQNYYISSSLCPAMANGITPFMCLVHSSARCGAMAHSRLYAQGVIYCIWPDMRLSIMYFLLSVLRKANIRVKIT